MVPLPLLLPSVADSFVHGLFATLHLSNCAHAWWWGIVIGMAGFVGLGCKAQATAWLGFCALLGAAVSEAALSFQADMPRYPESIFYSAIQLLGLGWVACVLLVSRWHAVDGLCRILVGSYVIVHAGVCLAQLAIVQVGGVDALKHSAFLHRLLFVRQGDLVYRQAVRLSGMVYDPNVLGCLVLLSWPAAYGWSQKAAQAAKVITSLVPLAAGCVVAVTYSRSSYIGLAVQLVLLSALAVNERKKSEGAVATCRRARYRFVPAVAMLGLGFCAGMARPGVTHRVLCISDTSDLSIANRVRVYSDALRVIAERPLQGQGIGVFSEITERSYRLPTVLKAFPRVESSVLHAVVELGGLGVALFGMSLFGLRMWRKNVFRSRREEDASRRMWTLVGAAGACVPMATNDISVVPGVFVPLLATIAATAMETRRRLERLEPAQGGAGRWEILVPTAVTLLSLALSSISPMTPIERLHRALVNCVAGSNRSAAWCVQDFLRGVQIEYHGDDPQPPGRWSDLRIAQAVQNKIDSGTVDPNALVSLSNGPATFQSRTVHPVSRVSVADTCRLLLGSNDEACAGVLLQLAGNDCADTAARHVALEPKPAAQGSHALSLALTPVQALQSMVHLLKDDLQGSATLYGSAVHDAVVPGEDLVSLSASNSVYQISGVRANSCQAAVIAAGDAHFWAASVAVAGAKGESRDVGREVTDAVGQFYLYCERSLGETDRQ